MKNGPSRLQSGMTIVELMIAIALMLVMTLQLQIIFGEAKTLYLRADAMAQVYQNARSAMDQMEKDITNAEKTDQMEFFRDRPEASIGAGHFEKGEEDMTLAGRFLPGVRYIHSMCFLQRDLYHPKDVVKAGGALGYRHDSLYFRTFTNVMGTPREMLVQYRLWYGNDDNNPRARPILQRIVTGPKIDKNTGIPVFDPASGRPILEQQPPQDMCYYVQEVKWSFFARDNQRKTAGRFYSAAGDRPEEGVPDAFRMDAASASRPDHHDDPALENLLGGGQGRPSGAVECLDGVDEYHGPPSKYGITAGVPALPGAPHYGKLFLRGAGVRGARGLAHMKPGDRLYLLSKSYSTGPIDFKSKYLTIKGFTYPRGQQGNEVEVSFEEETMIQDYITGSKALGGASEVEIVMYRGGWLPDAVQVQMKIKDQRSEEVRTLRRIFEILHS